MEMKAITTILLGLALAAALSLGACSPAPKNINRAAPKENGVYAVLQEGATPEEAAGGNANCTVLAYDQKYNEAAPAEPIRYIAIDPNAFVPMILEGAPDATKDNAGKTILSVTLKKEYVKPLEDFTRAHLNGKIAIILDGEIITLHKIRSVITEGKFQVSRCTDNACEVLRAKLMQ